MSEEIRPALSAEEWSTARREDYGRGPDGQLVTHTTHAIARRRADFADEMHTRVALANAALPDGDPRKITRSDVDDAHGAAMTILAEWGDDDPEAAALLRVAAKLRAILPPPPLPPQDPADAADRLGRRMGV